MTDRRANIVDLYRTEGQAELLGGRIIRYPLDSWRVGLVCGNLLTSLHLHGRSSGFGVAGNATLGYVVPPLPSGRESFCPDASFYRGPLPSNGMMFIEGPPAFAVEVRDEDNYGEAADAEAAAKRADYFAAGTLVVWDVDPNAKTVTCYRHTDPAQRITWRRGDTADAEPAVPGWRISLDEVFA